MSVNEEYDQDLEALETLSLTDFPLTEDKDSGYKNHEHQNAPSSPSQDLFEFCSGDFGCFTEEPKMSHAEDMISGGKLIPTKDQLPPTQNKTSNGTKTHRKKSQSMRELKSTANKPTASQLVRNSHSLDYKKLHRNNSRLMYEPPADNHRTSLSTKTSSSRWSDRVFGPIKGPPEMDLRDIRNRQSFQHSDRFSFKQVDVERKTSWGLLGILSCKSANSVAVSMPLS
ncbi:hypothetical protein Tco_1457781 [Tanacetum coccineum]